jgi:hypothetical protein
MAAEVVALILLALILGVLLFMNQGDGEAKDDQGGDSVGDGDDDPGDDDPGDDDIPDPAPSVMVLTYSAV